MRDPSPKPPLPPLEPGAWQGYADVRLWLERRMEREGGGWTGELLVDLLRHCDASGALEPAEVRSILARALEPALELHGEHVEARTTDNVADLLDAVRRRVERQARELERAIDGTDRTTRTVYRQVAAHLGQLAAGLHRLDRPTTPTPDESQDDPPQGFDPAAN